MILNKNLAKKVLFFFFISYHIILILCFNTSLYMCDFDILPGLLMKFDAFILQKYSLALYMDFEEF